MSNVLVCPFFVAKRYGDTKVVVCTIASDAEVGFW